MKFDNQIKAILESINKDSEVDSSGATPEFDKDGTKVWYLNGKLHRIDGPAIEGANGDKRWYLNGKQHRIDGPAMEYTNGDKEWFLNGRLHRIDGPAIEYTNGSKCWFLNDELHRIDGPAVEDADGTKEWYLNGKKYSEEKYWKHPEVVAHRKLRHLDPKNYKIARGLLDI